MEHLEEIDHYLKELFPLKRGLSGPDNLSTLQRLKEIAPLNILSVPTGKNVYDWKIPKTWRVDNAYIETMDGKRLIDIKDNYLHVAINSIPINGVYKYEEIKEKLYTSEVDSEAIPYRTIYYQNDWGFCLTKNQKKTIAKYSEINVVIESKFIDDYPMHYGELLVPGQSNKEILVSTYICHPCLANDNLSGMVTTALIARWLSKKRNRKYSYRFVWVPETIGAIAYSYINEKKISDIDVGFIVTTTAGYGEMGIKESYDSEHIINRIVSEVLEKKDCGYKQYKFDIHGSDERQYSSPGFRINCVTISKSKYYTYKEYHTNKDNLNCISAENLISTLDIYKEVIDKLDNTSEDILKKSKVSRQKQKGEAYLYPKIRFCERMLSKHRLYPSTGGSINPGKKQNILLDTILWVLFYVDGNNTEEEICEFIGDKERAKECIDILIEKKLIYSRIY